MVTLKINGQVHQVDVPVDMQAARGCGAAALGVRRIKPCSKELNARIVDGAGISPDDLMIQLAEAPGENVSFGHGLAQRASISPAA